MAKYFRFEESIQRAANVAFCRENNIEISEYATYIYENPAFETEVGLVYLDRKNFGKSYEWPKMLVPL